MLTGKDGADVTGWAPPPVPRTRVPGFPAAARGPADRACVVGFSIVGVSFAVLKATNSPADLSYVLAAQIAPSLVFALIGGVAADRFPPQRVIVAANVLMALGEGTFGVLVLTSRPPLWAMIGLEAITGTGVALFYPASRRCSPASSRAPCCRRRARSAGWR